jgi:hypothetical protein
MTYNSGCFAQRLPEVIGDCVGVFMLGQIDAKSLLENWLAQMVEQHSNHGIRLCICDTVINFVQLIWIVNWNLMSSNSQNDWVNK